MSYVDTRTSIAVSQETLVQLRLLAAEATILNGGRRISVQRSAELMIEHAMSRLGQLAPTYIVTAGNESEPFEDDQSSV